MLGHVGLGQPNLAALGLGIAIPTQSITVNLYANTQTFYPPTIALQAAQNIVVGLFPSQIVIYTPDFIQDAAPGQLLIQRFIDVDLFYAPTIALQAVQAVVVSRYVDLDQFYAPNFVGALTDQTITVGHLFNGQSFMVADFVVSGKEPTYDYPIGRGLYSDYGIRASMTSYKKRMIIGNRR